jgi:hypothetical protein
MSGERLCWNVNFAELRDVVCVFSFLKVFRRGFDIQRTVYGGVVEVDKVLS